MVVVAIATTILAHNFFKTTLDIPSVTTIALIVLVTAIALVTSALFTLGKLLIGLYLGRTSVANAYGAAGSLVVVLLWVYYSAQVFFVGAEFTYVYTCRYGSRFRRTLQP